MEGGCEERVATYKFHLDQDLAAWKAMQVAKFYNDALLVPEINTAVRNSSETDGDHTITIFDIIKPHYDNIYARTNPQRVKEGKPALLGFHTNHQTKTELVDHYNAVIREGTYIERDFRAILEAKHYEIKPDGKYGNIDGKDEHDDLHMTTMIALKVSSEMDKPSIIKSLDRSKKQDTTARGLAEM
jgi:TnpA family transposase